MSHKKYRHTTHKFLHIFYVAMLMHISTHVWLHMKQAGSVTCLVSTHKLIHNFPNKTINDSKDTKTIRNYLTFFLFSVAASTLSKTHLNADDIEDISLLVSLRIIAFILYDHSQCRTRFV